jgi:ABC-type nitrate/sulfonate/bicarbonate transport system permease component
VRASRLAPLLLVAVLLGAWEAYARSGAVDELLLPAPTQVGEALVRDRGLLWDDLLVTATEMALGLLLAIVGGVALAIAMHLRRPIRTGVLPLLVSTQAIPIVVIAPLLVVWLGYGLAPKVAIVALVCFFPTVVTTSDALARVPAETVKLLRTLGATRWQAFRFAEAPAALPAALSGAKLAVAFGGVAAVFAEYAGSSAGLGNLLLQSIPQLETARAFAAVVVLAVLAVTCFAALGAAERRLAPWAHTRKDPA